MLVNVISESKYFPNFFRGMHTAFTNHVQVLRKKNIDVKINSFGKADITHIHSLGFFALYKLLTSQRTVVSSHTLPATMNGTFRGSRVWGNAFKKYLKFFYNSADLVILFSPYMERELKNLGVRQKMAIITNPVDTTLFKPDQQARLQMREKYDIREDAFVILGAGHLVPRKGIKDFIEVAKELPEYTFVWVGDNTTGLMQQGVEKKFLDKELPKNIRFLGSFAYKKMPELFTMADMLFFPSYQETQGLVIIEAAACGLPLLLRDIPEYTHLYKDFYHSGRTNKEFKEEIVRLATDKKVYQKAHEASLELAKKFSLDSVGEMLFEQYEALQR